MATLKDGVYTIRNTGRSLMLDLKGNITVENNPIIGHPANGTVAQQWIVKKQSNTENTYTIQSNNDGNQGYGFFSARKQDEDEPALYTRKAWVVNLMDAGNDEYRIRYTRGRERLVLAIPGSESVDVKLVNEGTNPREKWSFTFVKDSTY